MLMLVVIGDNPSWSSSEVGCERWGRRRDPRTVVLQQDTSTTARFWLDTLWEVQRIYHFLNEHNLYWHFPSGFIYFLNSLLLMGCRSINDCTDYFNTANKPKGCPVWSGLRSVWAWINSLTVDLDGGLLRSYLPFCIGGEKRPLNSFNHQ